MIGLAMCLERGLVVVDLIEREMVWIAGEVEDVEPLAAWLRDRCRTVLLNRSQEVVALRRQDIEIDGVDIHSGRLRFNALAGRQQNQTGGRNRERSSGHQD